MKKATQSNWASGLLALVFALLLFFNANAQGVSQNMAGTNQVYDEMLYNVPVQLNYDQDKYFVSGYEETVNVQLSSANRIQLNLEANEDTRNFQIVADLTETPLGTSEVQLRAKGLSTAVSAEIEPKTVTVTIEKRVSKTFEVEAQLPDSIESEGYKVENVTIEPQTVKITTGEETLKAIDRVVAPLSNVKQSVDTIKQTVNVQALDDKGQILSIENPAPQVKVTVELSLPSKEVALQAVSTGSISSDISHYAFSLSIAKVEIRGPKSILDAINTLEVPVDITDLRTTTKQTIKIPTSGEYIVKPSEVEVTITPIYFDSGETSYGSNTTNGNTTNGNQSLVPPSSSEVPSSSEDGSTPTSSVPSTKEEPGNEDTSESVKN